MVCVVSVCARAMKSISLHSSFGRVDDEISHVFRSYESSDMLHISCYCLRQESNENGLQLEAVSSDADVHDITVSAPVCDGRTFWFHVWCSDEKTLGSR